MSSESSLYFVGGYGGGYRDEILQLVDNEWRNVTTMQTARYDHGVTVINIEEYWPFCQ